MLARTSYPQEYVDACRRRIDTLTAAFGGVMSVARERAMDPADRDRVTTFERELFTNLVVVLQGMFIHRVRKQEGKDGNPCNEVRILAASLLENGGKLAVEPGIKLDPSTSVLHHRVGDQIALSGGSFAKLATAYFAEIEKRYPPSPAPAYEIAG